MLELNKIHLGNCFDLLPLIPDGSVDAVITDPPYETTGLHFDKPGRIDWDLFYSEIRRVLKINGWFFMFGTLDMCAKAMEYFREKFTYIWVKNGIVFQTANTVKPFSKHEFIWVFIKKECKPSTLCFNKQALRTDGDAYSNNRKGHKSPFVKANTGYKENAYIIENTGYREGTTVLYYDQDRSGFHCTAKPVALIEYLLGGYTNAGDIILDPFMGSGTTALACQALNRNFIGMELYPDYVEIANRRLLQARNLFTDPKFTQPTNDATMNELDAKQKEMF